MNRSFTALAFGLALGASAQAQDAAQATAAVPATRYVSALADYRPATANARPAANWAASNAAVAGGGHGGHGGHQMPGHQMDSHQMQGHQMQGHAMHPAPARKEAPKADGLQEHHHEH